MMSLLSKRTNTEHTSQLKLVKELNSKRVIDLLIPVNLSVDLLTFRDTDKVFQLERDVL